MSTFRQSLANFMYRTLAGSQPQVGKSRYAQKRGYEAADNKARYGDIRKSRGSANYELLNGLEDVRASARYLARNSASMIRFLQLLKVNVVGESGFILRVSVRKQDGLVDSALNDKVHAAWRDWCDKPTVCGQMTMVDLQSQAIETWGRDGEFIWEIVKGSKYHHNIAINPIESDYLDITHNTIYPANKNRIVMGVELNEGNAPVAYHFLTQHPGEMSWFSQVSNRMYRRVPAANVIHVFQRSRPGQTRGEPPTRSVINPVKMLDGTREAETMSRRVRAAVMGFFTKDKATSDNIAELATEEVETDEGPKYIMEMEPGSLTELPPGMNFEQFDPGGAQTDYAEFEGAVKTDISMGLGISAMSHGMQTSGVSYSAGRTIIGEDRDYYKTLQRFVIDGAMKRLFPAWLSMEGLRTESEIRPSRVSAILKAFKFRGRGWDWVDPAKDVSSNTEALKTKQTSLTRVAAQRGIDFDELLDEIASEQEAAKQRGLTLDYNTVSSGVVKEPEVETDED